MKTNAYVWTAWLITSTSAVLLTYNPLYLAALLLILGATARSKGINTVRYLKTGMLFGLLPFAVNALFVHRGNTVVTTIPARVSILSAKIPLPLLSGAITLESILFGLITMLLLVDMLLAFGIYSAMVNPDSLLRITPRRLAGSSLLTSIAMRFTPVISDDMKSIIDAQRSRGLNLRQGSLPQRLLKHKALIVPALVNTLERSFNLAESMAARAYNKNRTVYSREEWSSMDYLKTTLLAASLLALLWCKTSGMLAYWPYDSLTPNVSIIPVISMLPLLALTQNGRSR